MRAEYKWGPKADKLPQRYPVIYRLAHPHLLPKSHQCRQWPVNSLTCCPQILSSTSPQGRLYSSQVSLEGGSKTNLWVAVPRNIMPCPAAFQMSSQHHQPLNEGEDDIYCRVTQVPSQDPRKDGSRAKYNKATILKSKIVAIVGVVPDEM